MRSGNSLAVAAKRRRSLGRLDVVFVDEGESRRPGGGSSPPPPLGPSSGIPGAVAERSTWPVSPPHHLVRHHTSPPRPPPPPAPTVTPSSVPPPGSLPAANRPPAAAAAVGSTGAALLIAARPFARDCRRPGMNRVRRARSTANTPPRCRCFAERTRCCPAGEKRARSVACLSRRAVSCWRRETADPCIADLPRRRRSRAPPGALVPPAPARRPPAAVARPSPPAIPASARRRIHGRGPRCR